MINIRTNPDTTSSDVYKRQKHSKISWIGTFKFPRLKTKETINTKTPDIRFTGIISIFLDFLKIITNVEKLKAKIIIIIVLNDIFSFKNMNARIAVIKGIELKVNNVFATEVLANDWINKIWASIRKNPPAMPG